MIFFGFSIFHWKKYFLGEILNIYRNNLISVNLPRYFGMNIFAGGAILKNLPLTNACFIVNAL
jgi:hypothetical protein